jgi:hypothetical protein
MRAALVGLVTLAVLCGCGREQPRVHGDVGGIPMTLAVTYHDGAIPVLAQRGNFVRQIVVENDTWGYDPWCSPLGMHHHYHRFHGPMYTPGFGMHRYQPPTRPYLLAGNGPAQAQYLRLPLRSGAQEIVVPVAAGKTVTLSLQSFGGYEGWCEVGTFVADRAQPRIAIVLDRDGAHLSPAQPQVAPSPGGGGTEP